MNNIIFEDGTVFVTAAYPIEKEPCILSKKINMDGERREILRITVSSTYAEVAAKFVDNSKFVIRQEESVIATDENGEKVESVVSVDYPKYDFCIASDIIDHRDGRITVYMAKKTEHEIEVAELEAENAGLLFASLTGEDSSAYNEEETI